MPDFFPSIHVYLLCALILAGSQVIYAAVGFGGGMFAVSLLAFVFADLVRPVAILFLLSLLTEVWALIHGWRDGRLRLLLGLLPTTVIGLILGTLLLVSADVTWLKRALGLLVAAAGAWYLSELRPARVQEIPSTRLRGWLSLPAGLAAGFLAGLFGTAGPPVIVFLKGHRLTKRPFRATLIWYFFLLSFFRGAGYIHVRVLTLNELYAALWLAPMTFLGTLMGMWVHSRLTERHFAAIVSVLLMLLGFLLVASGGK